jgi:CHASE2 domain-containing sensor protein
VTRRSQPVSEPAPWKLLLWTAVAGLIFGLIGFGEIAEDYLRVARNGFHKHKASGDVVLVMIDDQSLHTVGNWPWPRRTDAVLIDRLAAAGANRIFADINFSFATNPEDDAALADAIRRAGRVGLFARSKVGNYYGTKQVDGRPLPMFERHATLVLCSFVYNYDMAVWKLPCRGPSTGKRYDRWRQPSRTETDHPM